MKIQYSDAAFNVDLDEVAWVDDLELSAAISNVDREVTFLFDLSFRTMREYTCS